MPEFWYEVLFESLVIVILILANSVFALSEMALVSARKSRLQHLLENGDHRAKLVLELTSSPNRFLSTIQFGITLVVILSGAFGGATLAFKLGLVLDPLFESVPLLQGQGENVGLTIVVVAITVGSLVIGELVPKRLALSYPEAIALWIAPPINGLSKLAGPIVHLMSASTDLAFKICGIKLSKQAPVSEEELKILVEEGLHAGVLDKAEKEMVESVLELDQLTVGDLMTPRTSIVWLNVKDPDELSWRKIVASGHSHFPVYENSRDNVLGMVSVKALWANLSLAHRAELRNLLSEPCFVPTGMKAIKLLETFKHHGTHVALVSDEFGGVDGLISLNDVLEAIVGEMPTKDQPKKHQAKLRADGSWLVDAMVEIEEFKEKLAITEDLPDEDQDEYQTVGGFVINRFGRIPEEGDSFVYNDYRFEVVDMDRHRIDKILVIPTGNKASSSEVEAGLPKEQEQ